VTAPRRLRLLLLGALAAGLLPVGGCAANGTGDGASPSGTPTSVASSPTSAATSTPTPTPSSSTEAVVITVTVAGRKVTPAPGRVPVPLGRPVELRVTSDIADEIHVHGYELEQEVPAGGTTIMRFTADQAGLFEVETHEHSLVLLQLLVK